MAYTGIGKKGDIYTSQGTSVGPNFQPAADSGAVVQFTPNSGTTPIVPDATGNVNLFGSGSTTVVGGLNTATFELQGLTNNAILVGAGTATITKLGPTNQAVLTTGTTGIPALTSIATDGQLIIGSTAGAPAAATLTAGSGITITNASNSITIAASGGGGSVTFAGDTGTPFSTSSVTIKSGLSSLNSGASVSFNASSPNLTLGFTARLGSIFVGLNCGNATLAFSTANNVCLGNAILNLGSTADNNICIGNSVLAQGDTTSHNVGIGDNVLANVTTGNGGNTVIGSGAAQSLLTGDSNIFIGGGLVANHYAGAESSNILIGYGVLGTVSESNVLRIGNATGTSRGNIAQGSAFIQGIFGASPSSPQMVTINSSGNLGSQAIPGGGGITTLNGNSGSATGSTVTITTGASNANGTALFTGSGATVTMTASDTNHNTGWGKNALAAATTTTGNVAIGESALSSLTTSAHGVNNIAIGYLSLQTLNPSSSANPCTAIGFNALNAYNGTAGGHFAVGNNALFSLTGDVGGNGNNFALGTSCGGNLLTGEANVMIGVANGNSYTGAESSNILLGNDVVGTTGESNVLRIGKATGSSVYQLNKAFICGINGITVTGTAVLVSSSDQLGIAVSSERYKDNIQDLGDSSSFIYDLRPVKFTLKEHPEFGEQSGLIAEEVYKTAPYLVQLDKEGRPNSVAYHELPALLLNEIQKLRREVDDLKKGKR